MKNDSNPASSSTPTTSARSNRGSRTKFKVRRDGSMGLFETSKQEIELHVGSKWLPKERKGGTSPGVKGGVEVVAIRIRDGHGETQIQNIDPGKWGQKGRRWVRVSTFIHTYLHIENPKPQPPAAVETTKSLEEADTASTSPEPEKAPGLVDLTKRAVSLRAKLEEIGTAAFSVAGMVGAQLESDRIAEGVRRLAEETVDAVLQAARYEVERAMSPGPC